MHHLRHHLRSTLLLTEPKSGICTLFLRGLKSGVLISQRPAAMSASQASAEHFKLTPNPRLVISQGDITQFAGDAIVNAGTQKLHCI